MASPSIENGYTPIANELLDAIYQTVFNATQLKIMLFIMRYTFGYSRKQHKISITFIAKGTGISKRYISSELNKLIEFKVVRVVKGYTVTESRLLELNKDYSQWLTSRTTVQQMKNCSTDEQLQDTTDEEQFNTADEELFNQQNKIKTKLKANKPTKHKYGEYKHVLLTDEQKDRLINELGQSIFDKCIEKLDEYIQETGKRYSDHNLTIRRWVIKAVAQEQGGETYGDKYKTDGCDSTDYYKQFTAQEDAN